MEELEPGVAPDLLDYDDEGFVSVRGQTIDVPPELEASAREAALSCPEGAIEVQATVETFDPALAAVPIRYQLRASIRGSLSSTAGGEVSLRGDGMSLVQTINGSQRTLQLRPDAGPSVSL